jgi:hypothetical protein
MRPVVIAVIPLLVATLLTLNCTIHTNKNVGSEIHPITDPHEFSLLKWEVDTLGNQLWSSLKPASTIEITDVDTVYAYFESLKEVGTAAANLEDKTESILTLQIRNVLIQEGITHPFDRWIPAKTVFPAINYQFEEPPHLLVISPRSEIDLLSRTVLDPQMTAAEKEHVEQQVDSLGYSSLVTNLGGVGFTYPTMIYKTSDIHRAIETIVEEWFHQYMAFKPLGWLYALDSVGWRPDYDIITMNETVAGIVSREIADKVYQKYYADYEEESEPPPENKDFDFKGQMRRIRIAVDEYLSKGQVEQAESYMNQQQMSLASKGYHLRKLNQAYFAFHGTYADDPGTDNPIGQDLQTLRSQSSSLKDFLNKVSQMTDYEDIQSSLGESR